MSTYSGKGDQWTIENPDRKTLHGKQHVNGDGTVGPENNGTGTSTVRELTKDLMVMGSKDLPDGECINTSINDKSLVHELDFDMGERETSDENSNDDDEGDDIDIDHGEEEATGRSAPGRRKKQKQDQKDPSTLPSQTSQDADDSPSKGSEDRSDFDSDSHNDDDAKSGDESVAMKGETDICKIKAGRNDESDDADGNKFDDDDDEDDRTVALSMDGRESDDEGRTVAFSDDGDESDEDDRTIAMSIINNGAVGDDEENTEESMEGQEHQKMIRNKTIAIPASTGVKDGKMNDSDDDLSENSDSDMNFNESDMDMDNDEIIEQKQMINAKDTKKSKKEANVDSDNDDDEMEFDMPPAEQNHSENEQSASGKTKSIGDSKAGSNIEDGDEIAPKEIEEGDGQQESVLVSSTKKTKAKSKAGKVAKSSTLPTDREWIAATDILFVDTEDKSAVTVKQIFLALKEQFQCKITKEIKTIVRNRLVALINGTVEPSCATNKKDGSNDDELENKSGSDDQSSGSQSQSESESDSEDDADDEASDYSDEEYTKKPKRKKKNSLAAAKKKKITAAAESRRKARTTRPKRRKAAARAAAKVVEAHKLRRKKLSEELKVRNEEMQMNQTKEDEERQEAIAAKFETNTDELRLKRLEDRLDLLQRLDETRISVVADTPSVSTPTRSNVKPEQNSAMGGGDDTNVDAEKNVDGASANANADKNEAIRAASEDSTGDSDEDSSSDEEDLVIVGMKKPFKPLKPLYNHLPSRSLQLLDEIRSPKKSKKAGRSNLAGIQRGNKASTTSNRKDVVVTSKILSPNRSMGARFALRNALKKKQRKQGNRWLARELGYKTEEDHLKDCQNVANKKRGLVVKLEEERLKTNERKQLRERLILQEQQGFVENNNEDDPEDEAYVPEGNDRGDGTEFPPDDVEEEDEEMKMAKEIEQEARDNDVAPKNLVDEKDETEISHDDPEEDPTTFGNSSKMDDVETQPPCYDGNKLSSDTEIDTMHKTSSSEFSVPEKDLNNPEKTMVEIKPTSIETNKEHLLSTDEGKIDDLQSSPYKSKAGNDAVNDISGSQFTEVNLVSALDESVVTPEKKDTMSDDEGELEFDGNDSTNGEESTKDPNRPRNAGWQAMLKREAEKLKKRKKNKGGLVEEEAEEEEEEEIAGLEDFGFSISKKNKKNDDEDDTPDQIDEDDLKHVVDDVSDGEGDEDAGRVARKQLERQEEKARHKEILRRMREGYDGRRGGIAGGGAGARGMHRFDQLVAADNREDAKRLGLLNDDELDSEDEKGGVKSNDVDDEDDEAALLDKMLKNRFLHRSDVDLEETFSDDEDEAKDETAQENPDQPNNEEVRTQERLAKRFAKRARMQRLEEMYGDSQEFSQQRLIDEDVSMKEELSKMRCGLVRRSSSLSRHSSQSTDTGSNLGPLSRKRQRSVESSRSSTTGEGSMFQKTSGSLSIALRKSQKRKHRTSFLGGSKAVDGKETAGAYKVLSLGHVLFNSQTSKSGPGSFSNSLASNSRNSNTNAMKPKRGSSTSSLFSKVSGVSK